jgi:hypothetical protein
MIRPGRPRSEAITSGGQKVPVGHPCAPARALASPCRSSFAVDIRAECGKASVVPESDDEALTTLLSQVLIAHTIELDNAFEERMPHSTTWGPAAAARGPWLISYAMWANLMRFVPEGGLPFGEVAELVRLVNLNGLRRWGYLRLDPKPIGTRAPERDATLELTRAGRGASRIWSGLASEMDERWRDRFGPAAIDRLQAALAGVAGGDAVTAVARPELPLPWALPVVGKGSTSEKLAGWSSSGERLETGAGELSTRLSRVLLALTIDIEALSSIPLHLNANVMRVVDEGGVPARDVRVRAGVSREAASMGVNYFVERGMIAEERDARGRPAVIATARGVRARGGLPVLMARVEQGWRTRHGDAAIDEVRAALLGIVTADEGEHSLGAGLEPYPGGWRAHPPYRAQTERLLVDPRGALPHFPMVLHRGGYPDGS